MQIYLNGLNVYYVECSRWFDNGDNHIALSFKRFHSCIIPHREKANHWMERKRRTVEEKAAGAAEEANKTTYMYVAIVIFEHECMHVSTYFGPSLRSLAIRYDHVVWGIMILMPCLQSTTQVHFLLRWQQMIIRQLVHCLVIITNLNRLLTPPTDEIVHS